MVIRNTGKTQKNQLFLMNMWDINIFKCYVLNNPLVLFTCEVW